MSHYQGETKVQCETANHKVKTKNLIHITIALENGFNESISHYKCIHTCRLCFNKKYAGILDIDKLEVLI